MKRLISGLKIRPVGKMRPSRTNRGPNSRIVHSWRIQQSERGFVNENAKAPSVTNQPEIVPAGEGSGLKRQPWDTPHPVDWACNRQCVCGFKGGQVLNNISRDGA